jgi:hypothetical protein
VRLLKLARYEQALKVNLFWLTGMRVDRWSVCGRLVRYTEYAPQRDFAVVGVLDLASPRKVVR